MYIEKLLSVIIVDLKISHFTLVSWGVCLQIAFYQTHLCVVVVLLPYQTVWVVVFLSDALCFHVAFTSGLMVCVSTSTAEACSIKLHICFTNCFSKRRGHAALSRIFASQIVSQRGGDMQH